MLIFLIVLGVAAMVVSAVLLIAGCMASAQMSEREGWAERPLVSHALARRAVRTPLQQR
jgi:hypothetical protein